MATMLKPVLRNRREFEKFIGGWLGVVSNAVSQSCARLLRESDVKIAEFVLLRTESREDRRYQEIQLTAKGNKLVPRLQGLAQGNDDDFFSCLAKSGRAALVRILKKASASHELSEMPTN
ncbi:MAG: hypothetical protein ABGY71_07695 [bacterium]